MPVVLFLWEAALAAFGYVVRTAVINTARNPRTWAMAEQVIASLIAAGLMVKSAEKLEEITRRVKRERTDCKCRASINCGGLYSIKSRQRNGMAYQLQIANQNAKPLIFAAAPIETKAGFKILEWSFGGKDDWDGFWPSQCTLVEAKDNYEFVFNIEKSKPGFLKSRAIDAMSGGQMRLQRGALESGNWGANPQNAAKLQWHFADEAFYIAVLKENSPEVFSRLREKGITVHYTPNRNNVD